MRGLTKYEMVNVFFPEAERFVCDDDMIKQIIGFIGLMDTYAAGLFVKDTMQLKGIGKQLTYHQPTD